jgi:ribosomal protein L37E
MKESLKQSRKRAALLEAEVCEACGVTPEQVRRLRWVTAAIERTRTTSRPA